MKHEVDLAKYQVRTDLISEILEKEQEGFEKNVKKVKDITVETIRLTSSTFGKKEGLYKTISFEDVTDEINYKNLKGVLEEELRGLIKEEGLTDSNRFLIIGLGNRNATPDALGPFSIDYIKVTRHLFVLGLDVDPKYREVSSFAPGVMGSTGIETKDVLLGLIERVKPDCVIAIDSLCASSLERLNKTIQLTNTGIHPGSGIGNNRSEISKDTIGLPVLALGIPTVVDAVTIVSNTIDYLFNHVSFEKDHENNASLKFVSSLHRDYKNHEEHLTTVEKEKILGFVGTLSDDEKKSFIAEVLLPLGYNLIVTPKEVDFVIDKLSHLIAEAMNNSLERR